MFWRLRYEITEALRLARLPRKNVPFFRAQFYFPSAANVIFSFFFLSVSLTQEECKKRANHSFFLFSRIHNFGGMPYQEINHTSEEQSANRRASSREKGRNFSCSAAIL